MQRKLGLGLYQKFVFILIDLYYTYIKCYKVIKPITLVPDYAKSNCFIFYSNTNLYDYMII